MNNEILTTVSKYDEKTIKRFSRDNLYSKKSMWFVTVLAILLLIYAIVGGHIDNGLFRLMCGVIGVTWLIEFATLPILTTKKTLKTSRLSEMSLKTKFYEDEIVVETLKEAELKSETRLKYAEVYKIRDTKTDIYIYISGNQAFLCDKSQMNGDYAKVKEILTNKLGKNYICKCK